MTVNRSLVDKILIAIGIVVAVVFATAGALLTWGSNFANDHVRNELTAQKIFFNTAEALEAEGRTDLVKYAEQQVTTGAHANAYASYIDHHLENIADGKTYAELGGPEREAKAKVAEAVESGLTEAEIAELQAAADTITNQRNTLFKGETLRGLLLSAYAWDTIGRIAGIAAVVAFVAAGLVLVLVILGVIHLVKSKPAVVTA